MKKSNVLSFIALMILIIAIGLYCNGKKKLTHPLQILQKNCEAVGGLEKLKGQKSYLYEADFILA